MSPPATFLEPTLEGEIAIHRRDAATVGLQPLETAARAPAAMPPLPAAPEQPSVAPEQPSVAPEQPSVAPRQHPAAPLAPPSSVEEFERIEDYLRSYLEEERFRSRHPLGCGRWIVAWEMLWCADSRAKVIAVGQRAREAMHAFGSSLLEACSPLAMDPRWPELLTERARRADALAAVESVLGAYGDQLGAERSELLASLIEHWRALAEHVHQHEHGHGQQAAGRLRWEDGRRLVLLTALVMVEVDRSFG